MAWDDTKTDGISSLTGAEYGAMVADQKGHKSRHIPGGIDSLSLSFIGDWNSGETYASGDFVIYSGKVYKSLQGSNTDKQPDTETSYWAEYPSRTGADADLVSGTAGTSGNIPQWNSEGDLVDGGLGVSSLISRTTAAISLYVYKDATGAGDGTSWTDAFTTIQAAIDSLPAIIDHTVSIYVRSGSTDYTVATTINLYVRNGSINIAAEYYWNGECAAAATPSSTKFNVTATDGSNIAAGDKVMIRDGYADYQYSYVVATIDKGSNVWEIEINDALPTGNIGSGDWYNICKTKLVIAAGYPFTIKSTYGITISGFFVESGNARAMYFLGFNYITIRDCMLVGYANNGAILLSGSGEYIIYRSYLYSTTTGRLIHIYSQGANLTMGSYTTDQNGSVLATGGNSLAGLYSTSGNQSSIYGVIFDIGAGIGLSAIGASKFSLRYITISPSGRTAAATGIYCDFNAICEKVGGITNNATIPENPASSSDGAYIG